jgi:hypothetical protein
MSENHHESIFNSKFTLEFKSKSVEKQYFNERLKVVGRNNIIFGSLLVAISISLDIVLTIFKYKFYIEYNNILNYIASGIITSCFILSLAYQNKYAQLWAGYIIFVISFIKWNMLRYFVNQVMKADVSFFSLIVTLEQFWRVLWYTAGSLDFYDGFFCSFAIVVMNYPVIYVIGYPINVHFRAALYDFIIIVMVVTSYFGTLTKRRLFYSTYVLQQKNICLKGIVKSMGSGFMAIKENKIVHINPSMIGIIQNCSLFSGNSTESNSLKQSPSKQILNIINSHTNCSVINKVLEGITYQGRGLTVEGIYTKLDLLNKANPHDFSYIGSASYGLHCEERWECGFDVFGRKCNDNRFKAHVGENYEFIFNEKSSKDNGRHECDENDDMQSDNIETCIDSIRYYIHKVEKIIESSDKGLHDGFTKINELKILKSYLNDLIIYLITSLNNNVSQLSNVGIRDLVQLTEETFASLYNRLGVVVKLTVEQFDEPMLIKTNLKMYKEVIKSLISYIVTDLKSKEINCDIGIRQNTISVIFSATAAEDPGGKENSNQRLSTVKKLLQVMDSGLQTTIYNGYREYQFTIPIADITCLRRDFNPIFHPQQDVVLNISHDITYILIASNNSQLVGEVLNLTTKNNVKILSGSNSIECISMYYSNISEGKYIKAILLDEDVDILTVHKCAEVLKIIMTRCHLNSDIYILSDDRLSIAHFDYFKGRLSKPPSLEDIAEILK